MYDFDLTLHFAHQERVSEVKRLKSADPAAREIDLLSKISQTDIAEAVGYIQTFIGPIVAVGVASTLAGVLLIVGELRPPTIDAFSRRWQWIVVAGALALAWQTRGARGLRRGLDQLARRRE